MVAPRVPEKYKSGGVGKSFKGTALYLLHDADHASTDERVAWTETQNLATDDPQLAWRMMAATAMDAPNIQRAHHEATEGADVPFRAAKRSFNHVFHYSLSWRGEDEALTVTREDMVASARASLKELGGSELQALIICHNDTEQPHVHVLVNRVHPETGRTIAVDSNAKRALSRWARGFEKDRDMIVCPERERRALLREAGLKHASYERATPKQYRDEQAVGDAVKAAPDLAAKVRKEQAEADRAIHREGVGLRRSHEAQWAGLKRDHGFRKRMINDEADDAKKAAERQIHAGYTPKFEAQWKRQAEERERFEANEKKLLGSVRNTAVAVKSILGEEGRSAADRLKSSFAVIGSAGARLAELGRLHRREDKALRGELKRDIRDTKRALEETRKAAIADNYARFETDRDALKERQSAERAAHREAWHRRDDARLDAWRDLAARVEASRDLEAAYEAAKGEPFSVRQRKDEDARKSEADAATRTSDRTSQSSFDAASGQSPAGWAKEAAAKASPSTRDAAGDFGKASKVSRGGPDAGPSKE